jgi:NAD-specific glutamate dehydrogenase
MYRRRGRRPKWFRSSFCRDRILCRLALAVVEIRGDGDDRLRDGLPQIGFGVGFELAQDHGADFLRRIFLAGHREFDAHIVGWSFNNFKWNHAAFDAGLFEMPSHKTFDGIDSIIRVDDSLSFGGLSDHAFAILVECDDGWAESSAFCGGDDGGCAAFHHRDNAVGGSEVNANDFSHVGTPCWWFSMAEC